MRNDRDDAAASVEILNTFLRGEIAAVEAYRHVIARLGADAPDELEACLDSHQARVGLMRQRILQLGGTAAQGSGWWGAFAAVVEGISTLLGERSAIAGLEQGEDQASNDYLEEHGALDIESQRLIEARILPEQLRTLAVVRALLRSLS
jgi:hypothetical protein